MSRRRERRPGSGPRAEEGRQASEEIARHDRFVVRGTEVMAGIIRRRSPGKFSEEPRFHAERPIGEPLSSRIRNRENEPTALRIKSIVGADSRPIVPEPSSKSRKRSQGQTRTRLQPERPTTTKTTRRLLDHPRLRTTTDTRFGVAQVVPATDLIPNLEGDWVENRCRRGWVRIPPGKSSKPDKSGFIRDSHGKQGSQCVQDLTPDGIPAGTRSEILVGQAFQPDDSYQAGKPDVRKDSRF